MGCVKQQQKLQLDLLRPSSLPIPTRPVPSRPIPCRTEPYRNDTVPSVPCCAIPCRAEPYRNDTMPCRAVPYGTVPWRTVPYVTGFVSPSRIRYCSIIICIPAQGNRVTLLPRSTRPAPAVFFYLFCGKRHGIPAVRTQVFTSRRRPLWPAPLTLESLCR